jgi:two-component system, LytTR family, response regulator LytT
MDMRVVIIEDELVAQQHLQSMLMEIDPDIAVSATLDSIEASVKYFETNPEVDLVFMDIELGDGQSFDIFKSISIEAPIIFITAYQEHALKAFKLNSVDYLLKPVDKNELSSALGKYRKLHVDQKQKLHTNILSLLNKVENFGKGRTRYLAKSGTRLISVLTEDISYIYTKDRLQYIKTIKGEDYIIDKRLDDIETELDPKTFFRVNRQFILNYNSIHKVHTWFSGKLKVSVQPEAYEEIIISRLKSAEFKKWLGE